MSRKFYGTYTLVGFYRACGNHSWITIDKILCSYGYSTSTRKTSVFSDIITVLRVMVENEMIEITSDLSKVKADTGIEIKTNNSVFDTSKNFTVVTMNQFKTITSLSTKVNKENVLLVYLYVKSYIISRKTDISNPFDYPEAFYKSTDKIVKDLGMSKSTVNKCLQILTSGEYPLLIKKEMGFSHSEKDKSAKKLPNIYVLNKSGYETEIAWAKEKLLNITRGNFILANTE